MSWPPTITVACVIFRDCNYLLIKELDKKTGIPVFNQPAGRLEPGETILEAAVREAFEESAWEVSLTALLGISLFTSNERTYLRHSFLAQPIKEDEKTELDPDIISTHWLSYEDIENKIKHLRSPIVLESIKWHRAGRRYPLDLFK